MRTSLFALPLLAVIAFASPADARLSTLQAAGDPAGQTCLQEGEVIVCHDHNTGQTTSNVDESSPGPDQDCATRLKSKLHKLVSLTKKVGERYKKVTFKLVKALKDRDWDKVQKLKAKQEKLGKKFVKLTFKTVKTVKKLKKCTKCGGYDPGPVASSARTGDTQVAGLSGETKKKERRRFTKKKKNNEGVQTAGSPERKGKRLGKKKSKGDSFQTADRSSGKKKKGKRLGKKDKKNKKKGRRGNRGRKS